MTIRLKTNNFMQALSKRYETTNTAVGANTAALLTPHSRYAIRGRY